MQNLLTDITPVSSSEVDEYLEKKHFDFPNMRESEVMKRYCISQKELQQICSLYEVDIKGKGVNRVPNTIYMPRFELAFRNYTRDRKAQNKKEAQYASL